MMNNCCREHYIFSITPRIKTSNAKKMIALKNLFSGVVSIIGALSLKGFDTNKKYFHIFFVITKSEKKIVNKTSQH